MDMHSPAGRIDPDPGPGLEDSVRAEQLALLTTNRADQYANILIASIVVALVRNLYPAWLLALWLSLCIAIVLGRSLVVARYKNRPDAQQRFRRLIIAGTIAIGVLWGLAATAILLTDNPNIQFFLMIMLGGMMAGGVMGNAASLPAMYGFAMPIIIPSVFAFATRGTDMHLLGLLQALFSGIVLNAGRKFNRVITDNIRLRLGESGLLEKLRTSESAMTISQKIAHIGTWEYDAKTGAGYFSPEAYNIFGVRPGTFRPSFDAAFARVHPDDRAIVTRHAKLHRTASVSPGLEIRLLMDDGSIKYVHEIRRTIFDSTGHATRIIGSVQDISVRRAAEQKLQFFNLLFQTQMEASPDGIQVVDSNRHIVAFNHRFAAMWRIPLADLESGDDALIITRIAAQVKNPEAYAARAEYLFSHAEAAGDDEIETLDGRIIERHSVALEPAGGGPNLGRVRFFRDITHRRTTQKSQELAYLLLRTQMEASPDGILVVDANRHITAFNQRFAEIWHIPAAEMRTGNDDTIRALMRMRVSDTSTYKARLEEVYENADIVASDDVETIDGRIIERYGNALISAAGKRLGHIRFFRDITERRTAEHKLQFANLLLKTQMEASPDGILVINPDQQIIAFNRRMADIWRISLADLENKDQGKGIERIIANLKDPAGFVARSEYLLAHRDEIGDDEIETLDGRIIERHTVPLHTEAGAYLGRAWFFSDITERRAAEQKLQFANILLQTQMEASPDGVMVINANQQIIASNRRMADMWPVALTDLGVNEHDSGFAKVVANVKNPEAFVARIDHLNAHPDEVGDDEIETLDGRILDRHSVSLQTESGANLGRAWFFADITERRAAEQKLQFANLLLTTQMEASPDGILVVDPNQNIISFSRRLAEIWQVPLTDLENNQYAKGLETILSSLKDPAAFMARVQHLIAHPDEIGDDEIETVDGRIIERHSVPLHTEAGVYLGRAWFFADVTATRRAAAALAYRDHLLHAVTAATSVAVRAASLAEGVPEALGEIGQHMGAHRVMVIQDVPGNVPPLALHFSWQSTGHAAPFTLATTGTHQFDPVQMAAWRQPLKDGLPVFADRATATGDVHAMLEHYGIMSSVLMPVFVAGEVWGFIGVDDCQTARRWTASEIETIGILADTAGALIVRERARLALEASEDLSRRLTTAAKDAVILTGPQGEILQWNPAAEQIFGYTAAEAMGKQSVQLIVRREDRKRVSRGMGGAGASLGMTLEFPFIRKDGSEVATEISVSAMPLNGGLGILSILRDITERKTAEKKLLVSNVILKTQMEASPDGILAVGSNRRIISYNQRVAEIWNVPAALLTGGAAGALRAAHYAAVKDPAALAAVVERHLGNPEEHFVDEIETRDNRWIEIQSRSLSTGDGASFGRIWFYRDTTERRAAEALALRRARFDDLTGLANRAVFIEAVDSAIAHANRGGPGFAVLFLDLDHFKDVNDTLGHPAGDALLREVSSRLAANIRETDTAGRFGGDEFAIAATEIHDPSDAALLAEKLLAAIATPYLIAGNTIHIESSIGIDIFSPAAADPEILLSHADVALYRAKGEGRGTYRFFTPSMDRDVHNRVKLAAELREAIARGELFLLYQPQVAVSTGRITGLEALVRWNHPTRGVLVPGNFIPIAEAAGLIGALGHYVLWEACRQAREWITAGLPPTRVSINVSALQFKTALALESDILAALHATSLPPHLLELELTETVLMGASRDHGDTLRRLRERGVKLSIDDFGTGYSSLDYLRRFPVDHIKIAQSFIKNVESEPGDASIVRAIIGLARTLRIKLIVEGVATRSQLDLLQSWGATEVQGFYFARPLPPETISLHLKAGTITPP